MAEDANGDFSWPDRIVTVGSKNVLNGLAERDDGGFVMLTRPEIKMTIRAVLNLPASLKQPFILHVLTPAGITQEEIKISSA